MNNKYLPSVVTGFAAAVLLSVPVVKDIGFLLIVPFAVYFALKLHIKLNGAEVPVKLGIALFFGFLTAVWAAFFTTIFETIFTYVSRTNDFIAAMPETEASLKKLNFGALTDEVTRMFRKMSTDIKTNGFSALYTSVLFMSNIMVNTFLGLIGGVFARLSINKRQK